MKTTKGNMIGLAIMLFMLTVTLDLQAQISVMDQGVEHTMIWENAKEMFAVDRLADGRVRICFRAADADETDTGEIYLASEKEFEELYTLIEKGLAEMPKTPVRVDLGSSILRLHFHHVWIGKGAIKMVHYYKDSPYASKTTPLIWAKSVRKIFGK